MQDVQEHSAELNFICTQYYIQPKGCSVLCQTYVTDDFTSIVWLNICKIDLNTSKTIKHQFNARSATSNNLYMYKIHKLSTKTGSFVHSNITHGSAFFMSNAERIPLNTFILFLRVPGYFGEPVGRVRIQETSKNIPRYYTFTRLIIDLLSNVFPFQNYGPFGHACSGELRPVQVSWDIYIRFARYLYSTEWSWIIKPVKFFRFYRKTSFGHEPGAYTIELGKGFFSYQAKTILARKRYFSQFSVASCFKGAVACLHQEGV